MSDETMDMVLKLDWWIFLWPFGLDGADATAGQRPRPHRARPTHVQNTGTETDCRPSRETDFPPVNRTKRNDTYAAVVIPLAVETNDQETDFVTVSRRYRRLVWPGVVASEERQYLERDLRTVVIRVIKTYRTVSTEAVLFLTAIPVDILAEERRKVAVRLLGLPGSYPLSTVRFPDQRR